MKHTCRIDTEDDRAYGAAINICYEDDQGKLWVTNGEYESGVNYCPWCGYKCQHQYQEKVIAFASGFQVSEWVR